ncbi:glycosyltransferase family 2 protein [Halobacteriovorax marinus]|uniref:glycosyltransferase family 2 protein n=1 Tax=Halobacteriovorax marinus TaxID=97084 RepID=UPI003A92A134
MKVSIVTVVWNNKDTIQRAIDSVLSQSYDDIEYIIIDGQSTDGTIDLVQSYGNKIDKFVSEPDNGIYDAMNKGVSLASGDVVGILNSDDFYVDEFVIEKVLDAFKREGVDSVYADLSFINSKGSVVRTFCSKYFHIDRFAYGIMPAHPTFFVKSKIYQKYGGYRKDYKLAADYEILIRFLYKKKISSFYLPEVIVKMEMGGASTGSLKSVLINNNREVLRACRENGIKTSYFKLFMRYPLKVYEYISA